MTTTNSTRKPQARWTPEREKLLLAKAIQLLNIEAFGKLNILQLAKKANEQAFPADNRAHMSSIVHVPEYVVLALRAMGVPPHVSPRKAVQNPEVHASEEYVRKYVRGYFDVRERSMQSSVEQTINTKLGGLLDQLDVRHSTELGEVKKSFDAKLTKQRDELTEFVLNQLTGIEAVAAEALKMAINKKAGIPSTPTPGKPHLPPPVRQADKLKVLILDGQAECLRGFVTHEMPETVHVTFMKTPMDGPTEKISNEWDWVFMNGNIPRTWLLSYTQVLTYRVVLLSKSSCARDYIKAIIERSNLTYKPT